MKNRTYMLASTLIVLTFVALPGFAQSTYEPYTFITLAGSPSRSLDGTGSGARFHHPRGVAVDSAGNVYVADMDDNTIRKVTPAGVVTTLAGSADGTGSAARFGSPCGVAVDSASNLYVADFGNNTIRKVTPTGVVTTLAGLSGSEGSADGAQSDARFHLYYLSGIAVDSASNVYVADTVNHTIRKVTPAGVVTTLAGRAGSQGTADGTANAARFQYPSGVAVDTAGNVYVANLGTIRKVTPTGEVTTLAGLAGEGGSADGTGSAARFGMPTGVAVDRAGNVYVADTANHTIRKVTPEGVVTTLAGLAQTNADGLLVGGYADGTGSTARFFYPQGVSVDSAGNVYVADVNNNTIRKVTPAGVVTTLAGLADSPGSADGTGSTARFWLPSGVAVDTARNVYVTDGNSIRKVTPAGVATTLAGLAVILGSVDGTGSAARFAGPSGVAVDSSDNVYVADTQNQTIRKITPAGVVSTLAGLAEHGGSVDGTGSAARFGSPTGVAVDRAGNVYVADREGSAIRKVTPDGLVSTLAGLAGSTGSADGIGREARFGWPNGVAVDSAGNVYVAEGRSLAGEQGLGHATIRKITPVGLVSTLAGQVQQYGSADGTGSDARFYNPAGVAVDSAGNVYVTDSMNGTIRKVTPEGVVTTLAGLAQTNVGGYADGTGSAARFRADWHGGQGVAVDSAGNLYVADTGNYTIRKGYPATMILNSAFDGNQFVLNLTGPVGRSVTLEASTDLVSWLALGTASFFTGQISMTDPDASDFPLRFYRVIPSAE